VFNVGDYISIKETADEKLSYVMNDALIVREIDDEKITAQYGSNGVKVIVFINDCEPIEPITVFDITVLFDNGIEKTIPHVEDHEELDNSIMCYDCADGTSNMINKNKVCCYTISPEYKIWVDKYGIIRKIRE
jgi:hypothetical protein